MSVRFNRINVINVPVDALSMKETLDIIDSAIKERKKLHHNVVNAAKIVHMQKDTELREAIVNSDIINADGMAVVWASKLLGRPLPERVAGIDLMQNLVKLSAKRGYRIFFLGAREEVVSKLVSKYSEEYTSAIIAGYRNGYFSKEEELAIVENISASDADILFVAISSPVKEFFLNKYKDIMNVRFIMGVGGSFDVAAGITKRAPGWMQRVGLEWFYRVLQEPRRLWKRYLVTNSLFIWYLLKAKFFPAA